MIAITNIKSFYQVDRNLDIANEWDKISADVRVNGPYYRVHTVFVAGDEVCQQHFSTLAISTLI